MHPANKCWHRVYVYKGVRKERKRWRTSIIESEEDNFEVREEVAQLEEIKF